MDRDEMKRIARTWFEEVLNRRNPDAINAAYAETYVFHSNGRPPTGKAEAREVAEMLLGASSDRQAFVDDQLVDGDKVVTRWHTEATHTGPMFGVPATGRHMSIGGIVITRIEDGRIAEEWEYNTAPMVAASLRNSE